MFPFLCFHLWVFALVRNYLTVKYQKRMQGMVGSLYPRLASKKPLLNPLLTYSFNPSYSFGYSPDPIETLYDNLLKCCYFLPCLKQIHSALVTSSLLSTSLHLGAQTILKYAKLGDPTTARALFDCIRSRGENKSSSFLWNTMVRAYASCGLCFETLELYCLMRRTGVSPNNYTFPFVFKACGSIKLIVHGKVVHGDALKTGFGSDFHVEAALVNGYAKCGELGDARKIFDEMPIKDLVFWTVMITAYERAERPDEALSLFQKMQQEGGLSADAVAVVSVASAVGQLGDAKRALSVHGYAVRNLLLGDVCVDNSIMGMYTKCGAMEKARLVFGLMGERNVISWNSLLSGYTQNGQASEALLLFDEMKDSGLEPTPVTALIMVAACAYLGCRQVGRNLHDFIIDKEMSIDTNLRNALMDMYAKCGDLETAVEMFNGMHPREMDSSSWNVLISAYGVHGQGKEALELFARMQEEGVEPNHITFTSVLSACSHAGLVDEGRKCFADMKKLSVTPEVKHFACMVDMLGRAGCLQEAFDLIKEMPSPPNDEVWGALLLACKVHENMELGKVAASNLFQLKPDHTGYYILMSNIYAASNKWQEVGKLRQYMKNRGLKKPAAFSVVDYANEVHGFHTFDQENPYWQEVYRKVESLAIEMKLAGHVPDLSCALHDLEEEDKEHILNYHSEKLAVAFGILKLDPGMAIRVTKNLRVCNDCHSAFKVISSIYSRKIIVRDSNRFHHFEHGNCSCNDYW